MISDNVNHISNDNQAVMANVLNDKPIRNGINVLLLNGNDSIKINEIIYENSK